MDQHLPDPIEQIPRKLQSSPRGKKKKRTKRKGKKGKKRWNPCGDHFKRYFYIIILILIKMAIQFIVNLLNSVFDTKCLYKGSGEMKRGPGFICGFYIILMLSGLVINIAYSRWSYRALAAVSINSRDGFSFFNGF